MWAQLQAVGPCSHLVIYEKEVAGLAAKAKITLSVTPIGFVVPSAGSEIGCGVGP